MIYRGEEVSLVGLDLIADSANNHSVTPGFELNRRLFAISPYSGRRRF
jgi:hypothetical protein